MRIGYDITSLTERLSGVGTYTLQLLTHMAELEPQHEYLLLTHHAARYADLPATKAFYDVRRPFPNRMLWMQCVLPMTLRSVQPDLCHYTNFIGPLLNPCPYLVTIHDMTLSLLPQYHPLRKQILIRPLIPLVARRASRIITVTENARDDIMRLLHVPPERIVVIPEAAAPQYKPASLAEQQRVRAAYGLQQPYLLYIGTLEPRKNLVRLIRAWHELRRRRRIPHLLVIVGAQGWQYDPIYREVQALSCAADVRFTGYAPAHDLPALYSAADAFAFPSLYEGFGLPVIEAMACGTPTLISNTPALAEVAGDAALLVDPRNIASISQGLERLLNDDALRTLMRERGLKQAGAFSWRRTALQTLAAYQAVLDQEATTRASYAR